MAAELSPNAKFILNTRYLKKDKDGVQETSDQMFRRVAKTVAGGERLYGKSSDVAEQQYYEIMSNLQFLPNTPCLINAGKPLNMLSACYVLPVDDSLDEIMDTAKKTAIILKSGGGIGFSFSRLRPKGDYVTSTQKDAGGPICFMKLFDCVGEVIKQAGIRNAALMAILRVDHPDILDFIDCKRTDKRLSNFNISVGITDEFMRAVESNREYDLINPRTKQPVKRLSAMEVFKKISYGAWYNGEPGVVFLDEMNRMNPTNHVEEIESTNPCAEVPLPPYDVCNLGSINLASMVKESGFDWNEFERVIKIGVRFLDNVIDTCKYPLPEIDAQAKSSRRIGLGIMGLADTLIKLGIRYASKDACVWIDDMISFMRHKADVESAKLAEERGAYPKWVAGNSGDTLDGKPMRNAYRLIIAPTGSISRIASCSSGCEPLYALLFKSRILDGALLYDTNPSFLQAMKDEGIYSDALLDKVISTGSIQQMVEFPNWMKGVFVTAQDLSCDEHLTVQTILQKHVCAAISKTINIPFSSSLHDIEVTYMKAWKNKLKSVSIYRDGSRSDQVLSTPESDRLNEQFKKTLEQPQVWIEHDGISHPVGPVTIPDFEYVTTISNATSNIIFHPAKADVTATVTFNQDKGEF